MRLTKQFLGAAGGAALLVAGGIAGVAAPRDQFAFIAMNAQSDIDRLAGFVDQHVDARSGLKREADIALRNLAGDLNGYQLATQATIGVRNEIIKAKDAAGAAVGTQWNGTVAGLEPKARSVFALGLFGALSARVDDIARLPGYEGVVAQPKHEYARALMQGAVALSAVYTRALQNAPQPKPVVQATVPGLAEVTRAVDAHFNAKTGLKPATGQAFAALAEAMGAPEVYTDMRRKLNSLRERTLPRHTAPEWDGSIAKLDARIQKDIAADTYRTIRSTLGAFEGSPDFAALSKQAQFGEAVRMVKAIKDAEPAFARMTGKPAQPSSKP